MDCEIPKGKPLSTEETKFLLDLIEDSKIIRTKITNASSNKMKNDEWIRLAERFNATAANYPRTPQQLRLKWENLKKNSRKRSAKIRMSQIESDGGPAEYIPPDTILDRVAGMLRSTGKGFSVPFGGDKETVESDIGEIDGDSGSSGNGGCKPKRIALSTTRTVRKELRPDESRTARNIAIAEYFSAKKQCIDAKLNNIYLENESLHLRNTELKLKNEKLLLEKEKLNLELEKLKKQ